MKLLFKVLAVLFVFVFGLGSGIWYTHGIMIEKLAVEQSSEAREILVVLEKLQNDEYDVAQQVLNRNVKNKIDSIDYIMRAEGDITVRFANKDEKLSDVIQELHNSYQKTIQ